MVHAVAASRSALDFFVKHLVAFREVGQLVHRGPQGDKRRIEVAHVGFEHFGRVALGVNGNEDCLQLVAVGAEQLFNLGQFSH